MNTTFRLPTNEPYDAIAIIPSLANTDEHQHQELQKTVQKMSKELKLIFLDNLLEINPANDKREEQPYVLGKEWQFLYSDKPIKKMLLVKNMDGQNDLIKVAPLLGNLIPTMEQCCVMPIQKG